SYELADAQPARISARDRGPQGGRQPPAADLRQAAVGIGPRAGRVDAHPRRSQADRPASTWQARQAVRDRPVGEPQTMGMSASERPASQLAASSPLATISAGPVRRLAVTLGVTVSLPPGTATVHGGAESAGHSPTVTAAATADATAPVPQDRVTPD